MAVNYFVVVFLAALHNCDGSLSFASYYGDHMVLQKSPQRAVLWGYAPEGSQVTVYLSGTTTQKVSSAPVTEDLKKLSLFFMSNATDLSSCRLLCSPCQPHDSTLASDSSKTPCVNATFSGIWRVSLDPVDAGGPYNVTALCQNSTQTLTDVLFGDIWLCGGQSNMYFQTSQIFNASEELALSSRYPHVRTFMTALRMSDTELTDLIQVELPWSGPAVDILRNFSAVCWLFGRHMYDHLKYPVGLVESCWGGTPVEAWSSSRALNQCGLELIEDSTKNNNSVLWNAMIHPLLNFSIYGAIWYQGEANTDYHKDKYNCSFPAMINDWRMAFHQGSGLQTALDFPFGFVQLATYQENSTDDGFPEIRWHQTADVGFVPNPRMKNTFMAVAFDLPDKTSPYGTIHPRDKQDVAHRLTLGARAVAYGEKDVPFLGPFPNQILSSDEFVSVSYDQPIIVSPSKNIFEICCSDTKAACGTLSSWVPAAIVSWNGTSVQVKLSSCALPDVAALRYAWKDWPCEFKACLVYSSSGILPAPPFILKRHTDNTTWKRSSRN